MATRPPDLIPNRDLPLPDRVLAMTILVERLGFNIE